ncbi:MAG: 3-hydroxyacyl-CoA dehydrogenase family protein [Candidatus Thermoplasmatota archaeon]|jgi:3-hydroxybutyryl-CoA dehydrogenase|nr:3-hydroxyacyl-CoA dehydrogenase family protein [Candidatus Thermoplasmatota archaeon]
MAGKKIAVVGAGSMGSAIAEVMAFNGYEVLLKDVKHELVEKGKSRIRKILTDLVSYEGSRATKEISRIEAMGLQLTSGQKETIKEKLKPSYGQDFVDQTMKRIHGTESFQDFGDADIVIEAAFENMSVKKEIFSDISNHSREDTIIASNTSSLSISAMAGSVSRPDRVVITHFFNPPYTLPLVEIVPALQTSENTLQIVHDFIATLRNHRTQMVPIRVKEVPGFLVNRMLVPMMNEAVFILDEGVAKAEDIDRAMKTGAGLPMGPLELADMVGLDITYDVARVLYEEYGDPKYRPSNLLKRMVSAGMLGRKSGSGFYKYS